MATTAYFGEMIRSFAINATADYSGGDTNGLFQFRAVVLDGSNPGNMLLASSTAVPIFGVMISAPRLGEAAQICTHGETKIQLGATVVAGAPLMIDANGNFVTATTGLVQVGIARFGGAAKDIVTAYITGASRTLAA